MILHSFKSTWVQRRQCNILNCYIKLIGYLVNWSSKKKNYVSGSEKLIFLLEIKTCWRYWTGLAVSGGKRNSFNKGPSAELFFVCLSWFVSNHIVFLFYRVKQDGQSRTVRQFQFTDWPEQGVPKSGEGFIDFIGQVHKTKEQFGQDGPISVHCRWVIFLMFLVLIGCTGEAVKAKKVTTFPASNKIRVRAV